MKRVIVVIFLMLSGFLQAQNLVRVIRPEKNIKDYSPVFQNIFDEFFASSSSYCILYIEPGSYPIAKTIGGEYRGTAFKQISIIGKGSSAMAGTVLDMSKTTLPVSLISFNGRIENANNLSVSISNLMIVGNNVPYSPKHPFFGPKAVPQTAITLTNMKSLKVENIEIKNFYGNGIVADNYYDNNHDKKSMINSPIVRNFRFYNSWSENNQNNSSIAIRMGYAKNALIENCIIENDLLYSRYPGFIGIDLERRTDKARLRNNRIKGYKVAIWNECDYGGHIIENNTISQTYVGLTLSQDCNQDIKRRNLYSPSIVRNNNFEYGYEYDAINHVQNDWGFISIGKESFMLEGLRIENNVFGVKNGKKTNGNIRTENGRTFNNNKLFLDVKNQKKVTIKGNVFK